MSNYPDGLSEGTPGAPWNQPDPEPLKCDVCGELVEDCDPGDDCPHTYTRVSGMTGTSWSPPVMVNCEGTLREQDYCPWCNQPESRCHCDP